jgi:hypothetical protein
MQQRALDESLPGRTDMINNKKKNVADSNNEQQRRRRNIIIPYLPKIPLVIWLYDSSTPLRTALRAAIRSVSVDVTLLAT